MEIQKFQESRSAQLADFQKSYNFLKTEYSSALLSAIQEKDPQQQQQLVSRIFELNSEMTKQITDIVGEINKGSQGFDPKTLDELTQDLIRYQKQYNEIQQAQDRVQTLKKVYADNKEKLQTATFYYNLYLGVLIILCLIVVVLIIRSGSWTSVQQAVQSISAPLTRSQ